MKTKQRERQIAGRVIFELPLEEDKENWITFQNICKRRGKSASQALRDYIEAEADNYREGRSI
jgi:hypothetical protein